MQAPRETRRRAKMLRRRLSLPEGLLWRRLKAGQLDGFHFRKQHPVGPFILDFYCDAARLCIEVDGASHSSDHRWTRDERRDRWLRRQGVTTLRLRAGLVLSDLDVVLAMIRDAARRQVPLRHFPPG